jgi:hypothetical protein
VKHLACVVVALVGCATEPDTRPATADYIAAAILVPACGRPACHSSAAKDAGYAFDTVAAAKVSMRQLTQGGGGGGGRRSRNLLQVIGATTTEPKGIMPPDDTLPEADLALIRQWADAGYVGLP